MFRTPAHCIDRLHFPFPVSALSGPLEDDSLGEDLTDATFCQILYGKEINFIEHPLCDDFLCHLLDQALTLKTSPTCYCLSCLTQSPSVSSPKGKDENTKPMHICDRVCRLDSGVELDSPGLFASCHPSLTLNTTSINSFATCRLEVESSDCCNLASEQHSYFNRQPTCTNIICPSPASSGISSMLSPTFKSPPQSASKSPTSSFVDNSTEMCSCSSRTELINTCDSEKSDFVQNHEQLLCHNIVTSDELPPPLDHSDSGIGLESDPGFYDADSGVDEDLDDCVSSTHEQQQFDSFLENDIDSSHDKDTGSSSKLTVPLASNQSPGSTGVGPFDNCNCGAHKFDENPCDQSPEKQASKGSEDVPWLEKGSAEKTNLPTSGKKLPFFRGQRLSSIMTFSLSTSTD